MADRLNALNFQHLQYFSVVAREGGLAAAGRALHLTHSTLSAQIRSLEDQLGEKLFRRLGRRLVLTDTGHVVQQYAEEIFALGRELVDTVAGRGEGKVPRLAVGVVDVVPKVVVRELMRPATSGPEPVKLIVHESSYEALLASLSLHMLDVVIADAPLPPSAGVKAHEHLLGETTVTVFGAPAMAAKYRAGFPNSLEGAPVLLPLESARLRRAMEQWFEARALGPNRIAEFEDSALLKVFGADGLGLFVAPTVVAEEVCRQYGVEIVGEIPEVTERFYAVSLDRKLKIPVVMAICDAARQHLFASHGQRP